MSPGEDKQDFKREALPQDIEPYRKEANSVSQDVFERRLPFPFLLYGRSKLWDPKLLAARSGGTETRMVKYEFYEGGMTFLHPVRKRQTDPNDPGVILGRSTRQDVIVPISSISSAHAVFRPPVVGTTPLLWTITDLGSSNGTWVNEEKLEAQRTVPIQDGQSIRLGGNLIAWFLYPGRLWYLLKHPDDMKKLTDL